MRAFPFGHAAGTGAQDTVDAVLDGQRLTPMTPDQLDAGGTDDWRTHTGAPVRCT